MTLAPSAAVNYNDLIEDTRVHARLYYDPAVFEEEMEKIWYREWVFVGHDSEVPNPGDSLQKWIALRQVYLVRDGDGQVLVSQDSAGRSPIARYASYQGFVYGSFSPAGPSLEEHLGRTKPLLDQFVNLAPDGEIVVRAGTQKMKMQANWKMQLENSVDNYHGNFVHESNVILLRQLNIRSNNFSSDKSLAVSRDLGGGHTQLDFWPEVRKLGKPQITGAADPVAESVRQEYVAGVERRLGKERAAQVLLDGTPHCMIFPNLFMIQSDLRIFQPVSVRETYLYHYVVFLKGAPQELNTYRLRRHEHSYGPAGFILPDDMDIFERNQLALDARANEWVNLNRGMHRERTDVDGTRVGHLTDELTQRAIWRHYKDLMTRD